MEQVAFTAAAGFTTTAIHPDAGQTFSWSSDHTTSTPDVGEIRRAAYTDVNTGSVVAHGPFNAVHVVAGVFGSSGFGPQPAVNATPPVPADACRSNVTNTGTADGVVPSKVMLTDTMLIATAAGVASCSTVLRAAVNATASQEAA
jgi:hypothetical protein